METFLSFVFLGVLIWAGYHAGAQRERWRWERSVRKVSDRLTAESGGHDTLNSPVCFSKHKDVLKSHTLRGPQLKSHCGGDGHDG